MTFSVSRAQSRPAKGNVPGQRGPNFRRQRLLKLASRAHQPCLHGASRNFERLRRLLDRDSLDLVKHEMVRKFSGRSEIACSRIPRSCSRAASASGLGACEPLANCSR